MSTVDLEHKLVNVVMLARMYEAKLEAGRDTTKDQEAMNEIVETLRRLAEASSLAADGLVAYGVKHGLKAPHP